jgi:hypothetical protein
MLRPLLPEILRPLLPEILRPLLPEMLRPLLPEMLRPLLPEMLRPLLPEMLRPLLPEIDLTLAEESFAPVACTHHASPIVRTKRLDRFGGSLLSVVITTLPREFMPS